MTDFDAQLRVDYRDMTGLVLDCRSQDLLADEGTHTGSNNAAVLTDSAQTWTTNSLVNKVVQNITDGSYGVITANTLTTVTATLAGGTDDDWDTSDAYSIVESRLEWLNHASPARYLKYGSSGAHTGADNAAVLTDSSQAWRAGGLAGMVVYNLTDGSSGWITANTPTTVTATLVGGGGNDWDTGDLYVIRDPRFGNLYQNVAANQPVVRTVSGYRLVEFTRSRSHSFKIPLDYGFPTSPSWTVACEFWKGAANDNSQVILGFSQLELWRRNGSGNYAIKTGATTVAWTGDQADGYWLLQMSSGANGDYWRDGSIIQSPAIDDIYIAAADPAGRVGCQSGGSNFCDMRLRALQIWDRLASPLEVDFAYRSLSVETDHSQNARAEVLNRAWTDETGLYSRLNSSTEAAQKFRVVVLPSGAARRIQIAAAVDGKVRPDSELGGKLFDLSSIEVPGAGNPLVTRDAGWSSVFDVTIDTEGHYTYLLSRASGGGVVLHFDAESS